MPNPDFKFYGDGESVQVIPVVIVDNDSHQMSLASGGNPTLPSGAATEAKQTQPGVDIGDVTVNNASGASAVNIQDGGNSITVDGPLTDSQLRASAVPVSLASVPTHAVTQSGSWDTIPDRPSQKSGRTYKTGVADQITSNTTVYTVTGGKVLYIMSISISAYNTNTTTAGHIQIRDNTTVVVPISIPTAGVGALASFIQAAINTIVFPEPKQFSTNVNINMAAGTNTVSFEFTGYEE